MHVDWPLVLRILTNLGISAFLGGLVGLERELHGRPAGVRTHMLLVIGVALFCEVGQVFPSDGASRVYAQVLSGVGFLGAGTILRLGAEVKGLTTAASLWAVSAIAMAVCSGGTLQVVAVVATLLTLFTLTVVDKVERKLVPNSHPRALSLVLSRREALSEVIEAIEERKGKVRGVRLNDHDGLIVQLDVQGRHADVMSACTQCADVVEATWSD